MRSFWEDDDMPSNGIVDQDDRPESLADGLIDAQRAGAIKEGQTRDNPLQQLTTPWSIHDMLWFQQNPTRAHRCRRAFDGEWEAVQLPPGYTLVTLVRQVRPGLRLRAPWSLLLGSDDAEAVPDEVVHALFDFSSENPGKNPDPDDLRRRITLLLSTGEKQ
jgi:hypothetical protein